MKKQKKKRMKKIAMLAGVLCMVILAVYGYGGGKKPEGEVSVSGKILRIDDMQFNIRARNKVIKEDGSTESKGRGYKLTVLYDEETVFYTRIIYGNGSSHEDVAASAADMAEDMSVRIRGYYEGRKLHAVEVQLMEFK